MYLYWCYAIGTKASDFSNVLRISSNLRKNGIFKPEMDKERIQKKLIVNCHRDG